MPLYEYTCKACGRFFEILVRPGTEPACPSCQSRELERALSLFAVDSKTTRQANLAAGRRHAKKDQTERAVADREMVEHHHH